MACSRACSTIFHHGAPCFSAIGVSCGRSLRYGLFLASERRSCTRKILENVDFNHVWLLFYSHVTSNLMTCDWSRAWFITTNHTNHAVTTLWSFVITVWSQIMITKLITKNDHKSWSQIMITKLRWSQKWSQKWQWSVTNNHRTTRLLLT